MILKRILGIVFVLLLNNSPINGQGILLPFDPPKDQKWELNQAISDDFDYTFLPQSTLCWINNQWKNYWHNHWEGPGPTQWRHENVQVKDGHLEIKASRNGDNKRFINNTDGTYHTLTATQMGCVISKEKVRYPVYVEVKLKVANAVFANNVWMISDDDYEEIDICENYGGAGDADRQGQASNAWYAQHMHLSHHVFNNREGKHYDDYQPKDEHGVKGTWYYESGRKDWTDGYHRVGVYWKSPHHLEYYIDGKWVRTLSKNSYTYLDQNGQKQSHQTDFNVLDKFNYTKGKGLTKPMRLIINIEAQDWNAVQGRYPTDKEIYERPEDHVMKVDWIRVYQPSEVLSRM